MNYIHNLSKTSLKSSSSSRKSLTPEEVSKLQREIELLKETIASLKVSLEIKDVAIGTLASEKEKVFVELKSAQRTTRNLQQQLIDERDIHTKEKICFKQEIERLSRGYENYDDTNIDKETNMLREEIKSKDEVICNICSKYLKVKGNKNYLQKKIKKLQKKSERTCHNIIRLLEDNRKTLNDLLNKMIRAVSSETSSKKYLKLLKVNANLQYENIDLKIQLTHKLEYNEELNTGESTHISSEFDLNRTAKCSRKDSILKKYHRNVEPDQTRHTYSKSAMYDTEEINHEKYSRNLFGPYLPKSVTRAHSDTYITNRLEKK